MPACSECQNSPSNSIAILLSGTYMSSSCGGMTVLSFSTTSASHSFRMNSASSLSVPDEPSLANGRHAGHLTGIPSRELKFWSRRASNSRPHFLHRHFSSASYYDFASSAMNISSGKRGSTSGLRRNAPYLAAMFAAL